jgi:DNA-binding MarR family transcriptional regulator
MKTQHHIRQTSMQAWFSVQPDLSAKQATVLAAIRNYGPITNYDLAEHLGLAINSITPRTGELVEKGLVRESHRELNPHTGRNSIAWVAV